MAEQLNSIDVGDWHRASVKRIAQALNAGRLGHAQLLCGVPGIGKRAFAHWFAQLLLCEHRRLDAEISFCGECKSCRLLGRRYASGFHLAGA